MKCRTLTPFDLAAHVGLEEKKHIVVNSIADSEAARESLAHLHVQLFSAFMH